MRIVSRIFVQLYLISLPAKVSLKDERARKDSQSMHTYHTRMTVLLVATQNRQLEREYTYTRADSCAECRRWHKFCFMAIAWRLQSVISLRRLK